jgi:hypothetical protein
MVSDWVVEAFKQIGLQENHHRQGVSAPVMEMQKLQHMKKYIISPTLRIVPFIAVGL